VDNEPHSIAEQRTITDGRSFRSVRASSADHRSASIISFATPRDFPLAVVEAKPTYKIAGDGLQQAKQYAEMLGLSFAYASNGQEILEFEFVTDSKSFERISQHQTNSGTVIALAAVSARTPRPNAF